MGGAGRFHTAFVALTGVVLGSLAPHIVCADEFDAREKEMAAWVDANADEAIALLEELVDMSSGSMNHEGARRVGAVLREELDALGLETAWLDCRLPSSGPRS